MAPSFSSLFAISLAVPALAVSYIATDTWTGKNYLDVFNVMNITDPTHGRVNYVDATTAESEGLLANADGHLILRADNTTVLDPDGAGRNSVRLESKKTFGHNTVAVFSIYHMPEGCGTWPAVWTYGDNWPYQGEIDILEGVHDVGPHQSTLHTDENCTMPANRSMTGTALLTDCNSFVNDNAGCGVHLDADVDSYGPQLNAAGGGWYAMERTSETISIWFWDRNGTKVPADVEQGSDNVNPEDWGTPAATFVDDQCDIASKFGQHVVVINLTFCGDWAGVQSIYEEAGCPSTCVDHVNNDPEAFTDAYFDFEFIKMYAS